MLTLILFVISVLLFVKYIKWKISTAAITTYLVMKGYDKPNYEEMSKVTQFAIRKLFHLPGDKNI